MADVSVGVWAPSDLIETDGKNDSVVGLCVGTARLHFLFRLMLKHGVIFPTQVASDGRRGALAALPTVKLVPSAGSVSDGPGRDEFLGQVFYVIIPGQCSRK